MPKFLSVFFFLLSHVALAQTSTVSNPDNGRENNPYSKYGIGELSNANNTVLKGMGNITSAFENPYEVNTDNPASYSFLQKTTYEGGFTGSIRTIAGNSGQSYSTGTATFNYMNIGLPFNNHKGAICFGLKPFSRTYYNLVDTINSPLGQTQRMYGGDGALNMAFLGFSLRHNGFSFGLNVGYMFGNSTRITSVNSVDTSAIYRSFAAEFPAYTRINGLYWKAGVMYEHQLPDSEYVLRVGATFALTQRLGERYSEYHISTYGYGDTTVNDTSYNSGLQRGWLTMPTTFSIGLMLAKTDKWSAGIDFSQTQWSGYKSTPDSTMNLGIAATSYKIALGGEFTPNAGDIRNYWARTTMRMGLYYGKDYLQINGNMVPYFGFTVGASLPLKRSARNFSHFHTALEIGRLGSTSNGLIQETYVRFSLGISFTDIWFIPRKYD